MATELWVNDLDTNKRVNEIYVQDGGTIKFAREGWVNDEGVIKKFFEVTASHTVSQGELGGNGFIGYADQQIGISMGSIVPPTYNGILVLATYWISFSGTWAFFLNGDVRGAAFTSIDPEGTGPLLRTAAAVPNGTYEASTDSTSWTFAGLTIPPIWDGSSDATVNII